MIEALQVLAALLGAVLRLVWSLFWWWGPLVLAGVIVGVWLRMTGPGTGRRRRPRPASPWSRILGEDQPVDETDGAGAGDEPAPAPPPAAPVADDPETLALAVLPRADIDPRSRTEEMDS
ncbi:hypothetical protein DIZ27_14530 [Streptomyces sp. NWU339]|uniref:hypothetical protein n=1 Tax=Streptomyces sp. NWU339 TaxID=2185284 RepID=UPI000D67E120|nr:hypothetical protein [Streptomyces sp. NWU339]PWI09749.1 hypothetical protein DIZ27_14530 [Streptomyces sp. NWU339]